jgi:hypothetical protein
MTPSIKLSRVVIEGRTVCLCREHAAIVVANMPRTYEELRALFPEPAAAGVPGRRSLIERRGADDRRMFPPRPEGRRMAGGRRSSDEKAA